MLVAPAPGRKAVAEVAVAAATSDRSCAEIWSEAAWAYVRRRPNSRREPSKAPVPITSGTAAIATMQS